MPWSFRGRLVRTTTWRVDVELGDTRSGDLISGLADVIWAEEELGGKVGKGNVAGIVKAQTLYTSQRDVLGDLDTQALETDDEDVGGAHALHGLMA
ncbi:hypothetical protein BJF96_g2438 [Verticillium dahliae]|uniref:Uncharacterized protein n=1 Tax=Verticillium dahliae TaxID=27337 RepID=A0AA44WMX2_VERDA|nr:hypothetical protein BJF96_g2438 [Verticillium dahliae]